MEYPFGQFESAVLDVSPPRFLAEKSLTWCIINTILILHSKHNSVPATRKNIIPAETRTIPHSRHAVFKPAQPSLLKPGNS